MIITSDASSAAHFGKVSNGVLNGASWDLALQGWKGEVGEELGSCR